MVKIVGYKTVKKDGGGEFCLLTVQGGIKLVRSQLKNKTYFTARTVNVPATFDENMCRSLIGADFEGHIIKVACEPYEYTIKETGEVIEMNYKYEFVDEETKIIEEQVVELELVH
jgi:hypothetical protein